MGSPLKDGVPCPANDPGSIDVGGTVVVGVVDINSWRLETGMVAVDVLGRFIPSSCLCRSSDGSSSRDLTG